MKFVCDRCQTKYSIADERVRGKVLKVKCKTCANLITVREAKRPSGGGLPTTAHAAGGPPAQAAAASAAAPIENEWDDSARTIMSPYVDLPVEARAPAPPPRRATGSVSAVGAAPPAPDDGLQWYMALEGQRTGPFSRKQLVDKIAPLPRQADVHVWNEKLGSWKAPADVPAIANDLTARRSRPPTIPPGAPRRMTPAPPAPPLGGPPPGAPVGTLRRPSTGPIPTLGVTGTKLPLPSHVPPPRPVDLFAPAVPARGDDPSSLLQTPAPRAHGSAGTNGAGAAHGAVESLSGRGAIQSSSDVLKLLNLPGNAQPATGPSAPPPRLMTGSEAVGWSPSTGAQASRTKNARLIFAFLGIIAVVCVVVTLSMKKPKPATPVATKSTVTDPLAAVVEKASQPAPPEAAPAPTGPTAGPAPAPGRGGRPTRGQRGRAPSPTSTSPGAFVQGGSAAAGAAPAPTTTTDGNDRFRDGRDLKIDAKIANRPPPSQSEISRVISTNRNGIKTCYQRALLRDSSLTHGKVTVTLSIGISGRVKRVVVDGPTQFRAVEPCMREVVSRWAFPQASEEYGTEFVYVFQGNE